MGDRQPIPFSELGINTQAEEDNTAADSAIPELPRELTTPSTPTGERYGRLPTRFQDPDDETGVVLWIVEPGTKKIDASPIQEATAIEVGRDYLLAKNELDDIDEEVERLKPDAKEAIEAIPGVAGIHFEQLGLGLTDIEKNSATLTDEAELRQRLGPEFYDLTKQEVTVTFKLAKEILDRTGKPVTPEYLTQLVELVLEFSLGDSEIAQTILTTKTKTIVDKKVAATFWEAGKIGEGDLEFRSTHALTPDSKPRTAVKTKKEEK